MDARELVKAETAAILRHARIAQIKRAAFGLAPIPDDPGLPAASRPATPHPCQKPRPLFVLSGNARLRRLLDCIRKQRALIYRRHLPN
jgi:hypothetical protein